MSWHFLIFPKFPWCDYYYFYDGKNIFPPLIWKALECFGVWLHGLYVFWYLPVTSIQVIHPSGVGGIGCRSLCCAAPPSMPASPSQLVNFMQEGKERRDPVGLAPSVYVYDLSTIKYFIEVYGASLKMLEQEHCGTSEETSAVNRNSELRNAVNV